MMAAFIKFIEGGSLPAYKYDNRVKQLDESELFSFRLVTSGGDIILESDRYTTTHARDKAIAAVKLYAAYDERYERCQTPNGKWYFTLRAGDCNIVGTSPMYDTSQAMEAGINTAKSFAAIAVITDEMQDNAI